MSKNNRPKEEMTEEYKRALEEKQAKEAKKKEEKTLEEMRQKRSASQARREAEKKKRELETQRIEEKLAECDAEIRKAEKSIQNGKTYDLFGRITLMAAVALLVITITLAFTGLVTMDKIIVPMLVSWAILVISVYFQSKTLLAESKYRKYTSQKQDLRQALLKNRP